MKFAVLFLVLTPAMLADLTAVKQEPNSEKRSDLALSEATEALRLLVWFDAEVMAHSG